MLLRIEKSLHRCMPLTFFFLGRKSRQSKKREPVWRKQRKGTFPPRKQLGSPRATMLGFFLGAVIREKNTRGREASNSLFFILPIGASTVNFLFFQETQQASGILEGLYLEASRTLKSSSRKAAQEVEAAANAAAAAEAAAAPRPPPPSSSRPPLAPCAPKQQQQQQREIGRSSRGDDEANVAQLLPILLLGPSGIGKSRAARAWASGASAAADASAASAAAAGSDAEEESNEGGGENAAPRRFPSTVGADPFLRTMTLPDRRRVAVALWDCGGGGGEGDSGGGGGGGEARGASSPAAACAALGEAFFSGACAVILAYGSDSSAEAAEASLGSWLQATEAQLELGGSDGSLPSPPVVVVGLRGASGKGGAEPRGDADEAAARWAAHHSLRHFVDLGAAASAATLLALESAVSSSAAAASLTGGPREKRWGAADSASDAADVLGSLKCLGGGGGGGGGTKGKVAAASSAVAGAGR